MATKEERERYRSMWTPQLNGPTNSGPLALRHDSKAAVSLKKTSTGTRKTTRGLLHTRIKIAKDEGVHFQTCTVKALKLTQRRDGGSGHDHRLRHPGGRVAPGMNGTNATRNLWQRLWPRCSSSKSVRYPEFNGKNIERRVTVNGETRILSEFSQTT